MKKKITQISILLIAFLIVIVLIGYLSFNKKNTLPLAYAVLATELSENAIAIQGCDTEFLQLYPNTKANNLKGSLEALFAIKSYKVNDTGFNNSLYNSNLKVTVLSDNTATIVDLNGDLISAGTCDDPRIKAQIEETIKANLPSNKQYVIRLNGSEQNWKCWNDMSGTCN